MSPKQEHVILESELDRDNSELTCFSDKFVHLNEEIIQFKINCQKSSKLPSKGGSSSVFFGIDCFR